MSLNRCDKNALGPENSGEEEVFESISCYLPFLLLIPVSQPFRGCIPLKDDKRRNFKKKPMSKVKTGIRTEAGGVFKANIKKSLIASFCFSVIF